MFLLVDWLLMNPNNLGVQMLALCRVEEGAAAKEYKDVPATIALEASFADPHPDLAARLRSPFLQVKKARRHMLITGDAIAACSLKTPNADDPMCLHRFRRT